MQFEVIFRDRAGRTFPVWVRARNAAEARQAAQRRHRNLRIVRVEMVVA